MDVCASVSGVVFMLLPSKVDFGGPWDTYGAKSWDLKDKSIFRGKREEILI